ncbi:MAG: RnfABCDGE type electron transport complex subunit G, partial [Candidatus Competibacterales bacterium]
MFASAANTKAAGAALWLAAIATAAAALLAATHWLTAPLIAANEAEARRRLVTALLPASFDNDPLADVLLVTDLPEGLGPALFYRAFTGAKPVALVAEFTAPDGYSGPIRLLVGVDHGGTISGVRVLAHRETPGLGDAIETRRSPWLHQFKGRGLGAPPAAAWAVAKDGGAFDGLTGATLTARAVVDGLADLLTLIAQRRDVLYGGG